MALIKCPDCGKDVSDLAPTCPACGRPIASDPAQVVPSNPAIEAEAPPLPQPPQATDKPANPAWLLLFVVAILAVGWMLLKDAFGPVAGSSSANDFSAPSGSSYTPSGTSSSPASGTSTTGGDDITPSSSTPPASENWVEVKSWSGTGMKKTEPFTISGSQWRVRWSFKQSSDVGGIMQVWVQRPGEDAPIEMPANVANQPEGSDTSYIYQSGQFVLMMNCANVNWTVTVEEIR